MVHRSKIPWTDFSGGNLNFVWRGKNDCKCSPGCRNCYVDRIIARLGNRWPEKTTCYPEKLHKLQNAKFRNKGVSFRRGEGSRPLAFVCDTGDLFHESVPEEFIIEAISIMARRNDVDWQVLTKRIDRAENIMCNEVHLPENIWLGFTAENQVKLIERFPSIMRIKEVSSDSCKFFVSIEPMLSVIDFHSYQLHCLDWIIVGGESGKNARPMKADWVRRILDQCAASNTSFFFKQWSQHDRKDFRNAELDGEVWQRFPS